MIPTRPIGIAILLSAFGAAAQDGPAKPRAVIRPALPLRLDPALVVVDRLVLKCREGLAVRLRDGALVALDAPGGHPDPRIDLAGLRAALDGTVVARLFTRSEAELDAERTGLQAAVPAGEAPLADLNNYFSVATGGAEATARVVTALLALDAVETAYPESRYAPALSGDIPPPTPNFESEQDYLDDAPAGLSYRAVESIVGVRSPDHEMGQLEGSWIFGHEDCCHMIAANLIGVMPAPPWDSGAWISHGAACVGIMAADRNGYGMTGMGSATPRLLMASMSNGPANMISLMTARLGPGDVMSSSVAPFTIVQGFPVQHPLDFLQAEFDAIRIASAKGIFYTLAAGNGGLDLEWTVAYGTRYLPSSTSSGAFIIGATVGPQLVRAIWSNWGGRVDCNGWGYAVATLGYGDFFYPNNDGLQSYTDNFGGTSAAAPMVAGAIAALVGAVEEQNGQRLGLADVRAALRATGTTIPGSEPIGTRVDLVQLLARFGLPDGLLVTRAGSLGGTAEFEIRGNAGEPYGVLLSDARGRLALPANRPLLLNPAMLMSLGSAQLPASGSVRTAVAVPNDPALQGVDVYLQALLIRGGTLYVTNSVELAIR